MRSKPIGPGLFLLLALAVLHFVRPTWRMFVQFQAYAKNGGKIARQQVAKEVVPVIPMALPPKEVERIHAAVRTKALEAIALGNLPPGKELELISALDLGTIPWNQFPSTAQGAVGIAPGGPWNRLAVVESCRWLFRPKIMPMEARCP